MRRQSTLNQENQVHADGSVTFIAKQHWAESPSMPYQEKMRMRSLPESFTKDSAMVLVKSSLADTTDTSLRHRAHNSSFTDVKFDQSGYQNDEAGGLFPFTSINSTQPNPTQPQPNPTLLWTKKTKNLRGSTNLNWLGFRLLSEYIKITKSSTRKGQ